MRLTLFLTLFSILVYGNPEPPELVGLGIVSTGDHESGATVSPDGKTIFFTKKSPSTLSSSTIVICFSNLKDGKWSRPAVAPFSGMYKDYNPSFAPDGKKLFFISTRPLHDNEKKSDSDIWMVEKTEAGWSEPKNLGAPVNTLEHEISCSVAEDGTLFFSSTRDEKSIDIYSAAFTDGTYAAPQALGPINSDGTETEPAIAPDKSFLLFTSLGRPDGIPSEGAEYPRSDLYICTNEGGKWSPPRIAAIPLNSAADESNAFISSDGKTLYFTSKRNFVTIPMKKKLKYAALEEHLSKPGNGLGDIYRVSIASFMNP